MNVKRQDNSRRIRATVYYASISLLIAIISLYVLLSITSLILPIVVGAFLAYLCKPFVYSFKLNSLKSKLKIIGFGIFILFLFGFTIFQVKQSIPSETEKIEMKIIASYKINRIYNNLFSGNSYFSEWLKKETNPLLGSLNAFLHLDEKELKIYNDELRPENKKLNKYFTAMSYVQSKSREIASVQDSKKILDKISFKLHDVYTSFSIWLVMPLVFIFLLFDQGKIRRYFISFIPNRYFELSLTLIYQVDKAIGSYIRGTFAQCSLVGLTLFLCFLTIGFTWKAAILISLIAAAANAIPFLGPFIGLVIGLTYSMLLDDVSSILPFIHEGNIMYAVVVSVFIAQFLDNVYFQPIVLGNAISLHPLVVILGVMAGASILGWLGMLMAVPFIVILKVVFENLTQQLKAYKII